MARLIRPLAVLSLVTVLLGGFAPQADRGVAPASPDQVVLTTNGPFGGPVRVLLVNPQDPGQVYAGTLRNGLFHSGDGGLSWSRTGDGLPADGQVQTLIADPLNASTLYAVVRSTSGPATLDDAVYKTVNDGARWLSSGEGLPRASITALVIDPLVDSTLYAATAQGLYRSADGGASWAAVAGAGVPGGSGPGMALTALLASPQKHLRLFAGLGRGIARSDDGGVTWTLLAVDGPAADSYVDAFAVNPQNQALLFAATDGRGILRTTDGGATWTTANTGLTTPYILSLVVCPSDPHLLYAGTADGVFRSLDSGESWTRVALAGAAVYALACAPTNPNVAYAAAGGGGGVLKTLDRGATWTASNQGLANVLVADLASVPDSITVLTAGGDGVQRSADGGVSWAGGIMAGAAAASVSAAAAPAARGVVYAALLAGPASPQGGTAPDGAAQQSGVARSTDGGASWTMIGLIGQRPRIVRASPLDPTLVYATTDDGTLYRSRDGGATWQPIFDASKAGIHTISSLALDPHHAARVYMTTVDTTGSQLLASADGGASWHNAMNGLPATGADTSLMSLTADPLRDATLYAAAGGVYRSTDGGLSWQNMGLKGLQDARLLATTDGLYAASGDLLFRSTDAGVTWQQLPLPLSDSDLGTVTALAAGAPGTLFVGTTRGVVALALPQPAPPTPTPPRTSLPTPGATPMATPGPSNTVGLFQPSGLWYVPVSVADPARAAVLTLFNPHNTPTRVDLNLVGRAVPSPLHFIAMGPWQVLRVPVAALSSGPLQPDEAPALVMVHASQEVAVRGDRDVPLDRSTPVRPALQWYLAAGSSARRVLWIYNLGTGGGRVEVEVRAGGHLVRRTTTAVPLGRPQKVAIAPTVPGGLAVGATIRSLDKTPVLVVQEGAQMALQAGVSALSRTWYFARSGRPQGDAGSLTLFNPGADQSTITVHLCRAGGICLLPQVVRLAALSAGTFALPSDLIAETVTATHPVVAQAAVTPPGAATALWQEGTTSLSARWTVPGALTLFNPSPASALVRVQQPSARGTGAPHTYLVGGGARLVIDGSTGARAGACTGCGAIVESTLPLVVGQDLVGITQTISLVRPAGGAAAT